MGFLWLDHLVIPYFVGLIPLSLQENIRSKGSIQFLLLDLTRFQLVHKSLKGLCSHHLLKNKASQNLFMADGVQSQRRAHDVHGNTIESPTLLQQFRHAILRSSLVKHMLREIS